MESPSNWKNGKSSAGAAWFPSRNLHPNYQDWQLYISDSYFHSDFWYRDVFEAHLDSQRQFLHFDGINYKARIYLNGQYVGGIETAFDAARFDVTGLLRDGTNYLAVKIVWFMIHERYGRYQIGLYYDNLHNQAHGEDL